MFLPRSIFSCLLSYHFNDALTNIYFLSSSSSFFITDLREEEFLLDQMGEGGRDYGLEFSPVLPYLDLFLLSPDCLLEWLYSALEAKTKRLPGYTIH